MYSILQGDHDKSWRMEPFEMERNGNIWHPPVESTANKPSNSNSNKGNFDVLPPEIASKSAVIGINSNQNNSLEISSIPTEKRNEFEILLSGISLKK